MTTIQSLPKEAVLRVLNFVPYDSCLDFTNCCSEWSHSLQKVIRKIVVKNISNPTSSELGNLIVKVNRLIADPFQQLILARYDNCLLPLLFNTEYCAHEMKCNKLHFIRMMKSITSLRAQKLRIESIQGSFIAQYYDVVDSLAKVVDCQSLTLHFIQQAPILQKNNIPSVVNPFITREGEYIQMLSGLHHLTLVYCSIVNVSILASIPHLELSYCNSMRDISSLNDNDHVVIEECENIFDYTSSLANSRIIEIIACNNNYLKLDLTRWKHVTDLKLISSFTGIAASHYYRNNINSYLPLTLKRCHLEGAFVSMINFSVTSHHVLHELQLSNNQSITSLQGYGLERIAILELEEMAALQSLHGLGRGRNRKIVVSGCHSIADFSPLNHIPIVEIYRCDGFVDPLQVRLVRDLKIIPSIREISFKSNLILPNPYGNIHSVNMSFSAQVNDFDGLAKIPHLQLDCSGYYWIQLFLRAGKKPENQRIVLDCRAIGYFTSELFLVHKIYVKKDYNYYNKLPKEWIWVRKNNA